ncbi:MAG TPA: CRISPR-associated endonuclease Cas2 [Candidatus Competibacteraceae bacterium]|nr:CRISPR-associated endonuclease Cas2 [Candidatus Competibacteraceae bacterium]HSA45324.1 CRISPR-associated endonuclease Cas2 [Candidatus Competibacteraceae bacterium]
MAQKRRLYLICYDISENPKRLTRVARYLGKFAFRVQYSVFIGAFFEHSLEGVLRGLEDIIDPHKDDVRCYPLPEQVDDVVLLGKQIFPEDILLIQNGRNILRLGERAPQMAPEEDLSSQESLFLT